MLNNKPHENNSSELDRIIKRISSSNNDIAQRKILTRKGYIYIFFIKQLTDKETLTYSIIKPLINYTREKASPSAIDITNKIIYVEDCKVQDDIDMVLNELLNGMTVILLSWDSSYVVANIKSVEKKSIGDPELTYTLRGPKDCFTENLDTNLSLIRYRIKDPNLSIQTQILGQRTNTRAAVIFINDIANPKIVKEINSRLESIKTDGIIESGEVETYLLNNKYNLLPQMGLVERSDMACGALLEGKVIIIVEGSGLVLVAPKTFNEFLSSCDDIYDNMIFGMFMRLLRLAALLFSFTLGSLYIALVSFHTDILPAEYILTLSKLTSRVPFNATTSVLLLEVIIEILREALLRIPKQIGGAIGIVGAIIIGQAATASGIFSPFILILLSLSLLSSFVAPDYSIMNPFRIFKFLMLILTSMFGMIGFSLGLCLISTNLISNNSFGIGYMAPFAPFNFKDLRKSFVYSKRTSPHRPGFLKTKDDYRG